jgi:hypothetical protein
MHLYGSNIYWPHVKAQHLAYVESVLRDSDHYRHDLYTTINANTNTRGGNIWQKLHVPDSWTSEHMYQVTADLYDICLIMFGIPRRSEKANVSAVNMHGNYNSSHKFFQFINGNHFEPLLPIFGDTTIPSGFRMPEATWTNTVGIPGCSKSVRKYFGTRPINQHPWFRIGLQKHDVDGPQPFMPRAVIPLVSRSNLEVALGREIVNIPVDLKGPPIDFPNPPKLVGNLVPPAEEILSRESTPAGISPSDSDLVQQLTPSDVSDDEELPADEPVVFPMGRGVNLTTYRRRLVADLRALATAADLVFDNKTKKADVVTLLRAADQALTDQATARSTAAREDAVARNTARAARREARAAALERPNKRQKRR